LIFENYSNCARSNTGIFDRVSQYRERSRTAVRTPLACYQKPDQVQRRQAGGVGTDLASC